MADQDKAAPADASKDASLSRASESPISVPAAQSGKLGDDIAQILKGVKLPERRETETTAKKQIENKAAAFDTALGAAAPITQLTPEVLPEPAPIAPVPVSVPKTAEAGPGSVVPVHTLKDDLQQVVQEKNISLVRAASLEQDRRTRRGAEAPEQAPARSRRKGILFAVAVLCVLGAGAVFGVYAVMQSTAVAPQIPQSSALLFSESTLAFPIDGQSADALKKTLASERLSLHGALGSITAIIPTVSTTTDTGIQTRPATFSEFMRAIGAHPPDSLLRALSDNFFFGIHTVDINAPVFVVPVTSYDHAFAGMLAWEPTMNADLAPIFTAVPLNATDANGLPTTRTFTDNVRQNYDVRELKDDAGVVRLYYSFPTPGILVIAESPYSFAEVLSRLQAQREL